MGLRILYFHIDLEVDELRNTHWERWSKGSFSYIILLAFALTVQFHLINKYFLAFHVLAKATGEGPLELVGGPQGNQWTHAAVWSEVRNPSRKWSVTRKVVHVVDNPWGKLCAPTNP